MQFAVACVLAATFLLVSGCANNAARQDQLDEYLARAPQLNEALFGTPRPVPDFEELIALTPEQRADFLKFFNSGVNSRYEPHRRVYAYLTRRLADTDFQHRTVPASATIETRSGNCMSLALVTTAFARLANIDIGWQLSNTDPVYSSDGSVIYSANHIQTRLYRRDLNQTSYSFTIGQPYLLVDYYSDRVAGVGKALSETQVIALVYQNLGIEAMADGQLEDAFWLLRTGLEYDPANFNLYNALGVLHRRAGDDPTAEKLYQFALDEFGDRLIVLRNYRKLLLASNRPEQAQQMEHRIMRLPDPDPYPLLTLGDEAAELGKTDVALAYYNKATDVAPYLHEIYLRKARIHAANGNLKRAERALRKARNRAWADSDQQMYQAKLMTLRDR
ncbi:MAG: tetratricopeptide repeat protein [Wenzhouxiangellaceae bacterium]